MKRVSSKSKSSRVTAMRLGAMTAMAAALAATQPLGAARAEDAAALDPAVVERLKKEQEGRKACEIEICKGFLKPEAGAPLTCDVTKTWTRPEILSKVVGGSYVWGYGHVQCVTKLTAARNLFDKAATDPTAVITIPEQKMTCTIDDKDATKPAAIKADFSVAPVITFDKGKAKSVKMAIKTEGSTVASAMITSLMAADSATGIISSAAAAEVNDFFYKKCKEAGVEITPPK